MATKRGRGQKKIKGVLSRPIEYEADFLVACAFKPQGERFRKSVEAVTRQWNERYAALFEHYGLSRAEPDAESRFILAMAEELFPSAFKFVSRGKKKFGPKGRWTISEQLTLLVCVRQLRGEPPRMSVLAAAKPIKAEKLIPGLNTAAQSIAQRYYEAQRTVERLQNGELTPIEEIEAFAHVETERNDLRKTFQLDEVGSLEKLRPRLLGALLRLGSDELDDLLRS
jgi:hypothetical protein